MQKKFIMANQTIKNFKMKINNLVQSSKSKMKILIIMHRSYMIKKMKKIYNLMMICWMKKKMIKKIKFLNKIKTFQISNKTMAKIR